MFSFHLKYKPFNLFKILIEYVHHWNAIIILATNFVIFLQNSEKKHHFKVRNSNGWRSGQQEALSLPEQEREKIVA